MRRRLLLAVALFFVTIGTLTSAYQTLYCVWMTAHPVYRSSEWISRFYLRLGTTIGAGILWLVLLFVLVRKTSKTKSSG